MSIYSVTSVTIQGSCFGYGSIDTKYVPSIEEMEFLKSNIYAWGIYDGHMTSAHWADDGPIEFIDIPEYMFDCDVVEMWFSCDDHKYYVDLKNHKLDLRDLNISLINGE